MDIDRIKKAISHYKSDRAVINRLQVFVNDLKKLGDDEDPSIFDSRKVGKYRQYHGYHLSKSVSILYVIDYETRTVRIERMGDHKELYGRDKKR